MIASRFIALLGALSLSLLILGCGNGRLHILIPDFIASRVEGLRLFRVVDQGGLQAAGRVVFGPITTTSTGEQRIEYTQIVPGQASWGPLMARVTRPASGQLEVEMALFNAGASAFFRFATFNEKGMSPPTQAQLYLARSY